MGRSLPIASVGSPVAQPGGQLSGGEIAHPAVAGRPSAVRSVASTAWMSAVQREQPVAVGGRTHGKRHQADVRFGGQRWPERQLCEGELTKYC
jgi:hypothetical protein